MNGDLLGQSETKHVRNIANYPKAGLKTIHSGLTTHCIPDFIVFTSLTSTFKKEISPYIKPQVCNLGWLPQGLQVHLVYGFDKNSCLMPWEEKQVLISQL